MTTRFKAGDLLEGVTGTTHETGHALYEQQRPAHVAGLPVSSARSLGAHESQSLFWERHVGLTRAFSEYLSAEINGHFPSSSSPPSPAEPEALFEALNAVKDPSFVRVEAGESSLFFFLQRLRPPSLFLSSSPSSTFFPVFFLLLLLPPSSLFFLLLPPSLFSRSLSGVFCFSREERWRKRKGEGEGNLEEEEQEQKRSSKSPPSALFISTLLSLSPLPFRTNGIDLSSSKKKTKKTKDELSYPLHVILRVEIEAALLRGEMEVGDVPRVWGEKMRASLGCEPPSDDGRVNCLQDM